MNLPTTTAMMTMRATVNRILKDNQRLRKQNSLLREVALHTCAVCRVAACPVREKLMKDALGREWQFLRTPDP